MANQEDRDKIKEKIYTRRMFVTSSDERNKGSDTVSTSSFNEMSKSFANNEYLGPDGVNHSIFGGIIWNMNQIQEDISDLHAEVSASVYVSQISNFFSFSQPGAQNGQLFH